MPLFLLPFCKDGGSRIAYGGDWLGCADSAQMSHEESAIKPKVLSAALQLWSTRQRVATSWGEWKRTRGCGARKVGMGARQFVARGARPMEEARSSEMEDARGVSRCL
jgi:hypothetical protein